MPPGRQLAYCGKACRREWQRRGRPGAEGPASTVEAFAGFLGRVEATLVSRVGAGQTISEAWNEDRWRRELEADLPEAPELAGFLLEGIRANLRSVHDARGVRDVFSRMTNRVPIVALAIEKVAPEVVSPSPHLVYLLYDERGRLLYIGITDRGPRRLVEHYREKAWFSMVARVDIERMPSRAAAEERERALIRERGPAFNVQHNRARAV